MMTARPFVLSEVTYRDTTAAATDVAILPWGATEAHNYHLPYGTDIIETGSIAEEAAGIAWSKGARVMVLPTIPFGVQTGQTKIPLCINMNPSTQHAVLRDIVQTLARSHVPKLVVLNGHGGNNFRQILRELQPGFPVFLCTVDWFRCLDLKRYFDAPGDHADEMETSAMMHLAPDLTRPLAEAGDGRSRRFAITGFREGWAWSQREWHLATDDTGSGNPRAATPEKGRAYIADVANTIGTFLVELAAADMGTIYT